MVAPGSQGVCVLSPSLLHLQQIYTTPSVHACKPITPSAHQGTRKLCSYPGSTTHITDFHVVTESKKKKNHPMGRKLDPANFLQLILKAQ